MNENLGYYTYLFEKGVLGSKNLFFDSVITTSGTGTLNRTVDINGVNDSKNILVVNEDSTNTLTVNVKLSSNSQRVLYQVLFYDGDGNTLNSSSLDFDLHYFNSQYYSIDLQFSIVPNGFIAVRVVSVVDSKKLYPLD